MGKGVIYYERSRYHAADALPTNSRPSIYVEPCIHFLWHDNIIRSQRQVGRLAYLKDLSMAPNPSNVLTSVTFHSVLSAMSGAPMSFRCTVNYKCHSENQTRSYLPVAHARKGTQFPGDNGIIDTPPHFRTGCTYGKLALSAGWRKFDMPAKPQSEGLRGRVHRVVSYSCFSLRQLYPPSSFTAN